MRTKVVDGKLVPNDTEPKRQRNVNADVVGRAKANEEKLAKRRKKR